MDDAALLTAAILMAEEAAEYVIRNASLDDYEGCAALAQCFGELCQIAMFERDVDALRAYQHFHILAIVDAVHQQHEEVFCG